MAQNLGNITCIRGGDDVKSTHFISGESFPAWARRMRMTKEEYFKWFLEWLDMFDEVKKKIYRSPPRLDTPSRTREGVALMTKWYEDICSIFNSLGICLFTVNTWSAAGPTHFARLFSAYTGYDTTPLEIMQTGERIHNLMKVYNVREGLTRSDDDWPLRFYKEPLRGGPAEGAILSKHKMHQLLDCYYVLRGWDKETGNPSEKKLEQLGLKDMIKGSLFK
jgi:aldehyde:ferredoxin oxidoreductase